MKAFTRIIDGINEWCGKLISALVVIMGASILYGAVRRYCFNSPVIWAYEFGLFMFTALHVLTPGFGIKNNLHVRMDIFYLKWSVRTRAIVDLATSVLVFFVCGLLLWKGIEFGWASMMKLERASSAWAPYVWPIKLCIPLGALLALLQTIAKFIRDLYFVMKGEEL